MVNKNKQSFANTNNHYLPTKDSTRSNLITISIEVENGLY